MDIGSKNGYPASALSNFTPRSFELDGVTCCSIEGVLQSFKFKEPAVQSEVCKLVGLMAKRRGSNKNWKRTQTLFWRGVEIDRHSQDYQDLLNRLYDTVYKQCSSFRNALVATQKATLTHGIGKSRENDTILTRSEFCSRLTKLRDFGEL